MKEFIIFVCTDSTEIFSKLRSAGLNYNLPISNKHCLLTFSFFSSYTFILIKAIVLPKQVDRPYVIKLVTIIDGCVFCFPFYPLIIKTEQAK